MGTKVYKDQGDGGAIYREATDPRDKVYALLGLFPHQPFPSIPSCNYDISTAILYSRVTLDLIQLESCLRPLVGFRGEPHVTPDLPTWALDLTCYDYGVKKRPWEWCKHSHRYKLFSAGGNRPLKCVSLSDVLSLTGVFVDKIVHVDTVLGAETWETLCDEHFIETISSWELLLVRSIRSRKAGETYVGGSTWSGAFWRTMLGDLVMREFPVGRAMNACGFEFYKFLWHRSRNSIYISLRDMVVNQAFSITKKVFFGGRVPFVSRPDGGGVWEPPDDIKTNLHSFIGDAYVHGIMDGEVVEGFEAKEQTVLIC